MTRLRTLCIVLALVAAACEPPGEAPDRVAQRFWAAVEAERFAEARGLSTAPGERSLRELSEYHAFARVELGQVLRNENAALVETVATLEGSRQTEIAFHTHLARFDDSWRVEIDRTRRELVRASLAATLEEAQESLQESAQVLSKTIERGALEFSEALREALEEVERGLRGGTAPSPRSP